MSKDLSGAAADLLARARVLIDGNRIDEAANICREIVSLHPEHHEARYLLALIYQHTGQIEDAIGHYRFVVNHAACPADACNNLGTLLETSGQTDEALHYYAEASRRDPGLAVAHYNLARLLRARGMPEQALTHILKALESSPDSAQMQLESGMVLKTLGRLPEALQHLQRARELDDNDPVILNALGNLHQALGEIGKAITCYKTAIEIDRDYAEACNNLGSALLARGDTAAAVEMYRAALSIRPDWHGAASNILLAGNYVADDSTALFHEHVRHGRSLQDSIRTMNVQATPVTGRKTRIGYVSPDFRAHSVAYFIRGPFSHIDRAEFETICFSDAASPDSTTRELKSLATEWHDIHGMPDHDVAVLVQESNIDILVDLAGHTGNNRLPVFAAQPAPRQASYLGYPNTTGLDRIQYRLSDQWADPPGAADNHHTEKIIRLPGGFLCYTPESGCPQPGDPPVVSGAGITFGSFNVLAKISDQCLQAWCAILNQLPAAKLLLKSAGLQDHQTCRYQHDRFSALGIEPDRVELVPRTGDFRSHMQLYNRIDISLDTFPYNGTTTTCESLWMGVPVVTLEGKRHAGRVGTSLLQLAGLEHLIGTGPAGYAAIATDLAADTGQLARLRRTLRDRMTASRLCDAAAFTRELQEAFKKML